MVRLVSFALLASVLMQSASAFVAPSVPKASSSLKMSQSVDDEKRFAASVLTAAYIFANAVSVAPAFAVPQDFAGSTHIVAAKSGGRMGGRSSVGTRSAAPSSSYSRPSTTVVHKTVIQSPTVVAPPVMASPVYMAPPVYAPPVYSPGLDAGAVGLSVGLSAINGISREMREQSQEREIAREREELAQSRMRQAELEGRLRALEATQR
ncbi:expressed unknown protein [Seminavis robusta]|uniref:Uncharacterized protein n=1 Tax=Seminavis robusta TaxID=568900 RepID=A0A9N8DS00_9STRA|nr:expressed unknown protein [Seminavis robusta]|eukprot:Sro246_g097820.1 n/a (208) ;mRNA; f:63824-64536